jgi:hypothetical protein
MNALICISSSIVIAIKLSDRTPNSWMWITKWITCSQLLTGTIWSINAKPRSHVKFGLLWIDCDSQIRTKLANLWGIFDQILKTFFLMHGHFDVKRVILIPEIESLMFDCVPAISICFVLPNSHAKHFCEWSQHHNHIVALIFMKIRVAIFIVHSLPGWRRETIICKQETLGCRMQYIFYTHSIANSLPPTQWQLLHSSYACLLLFIHLIVKRRAKLSRYCLLLRLQSLIRMNYGVYVHVSWPLLLN